MLPEVTAGGGEREKKERERERETIFNRQGFRRKIYLRSNC